MATGSHLGSSWSTNAADKSVNIADTLNDLLVVVHGISGGSGGSTSTITDTNADGLGTYTRYGPYVSTSGGYTLWISVRNALIGDISGDMNVQATNSANNGNGLTVLSFSGMSRAGASAVLQNKGEGTATENPPTLTFGAATLTTNPIVLAVMGEDNPLGLTPPTGFTEAVDTGWSTPTAGVEVCWDDSGNTASLYSWSGGAVTNHCEIGIELDASAAATVTGSGWWGMGGLGSNW